MVPKSYKNGRVVYRVGFDRLMEFSESIISVASWGLKPNVINSLQYLFASIG